MHPTTVLSLCLFLLLAVSDLPNPHPLSAQDGLRVFVSVDMEGIGGIGTGRMTSSSGGKDYATGRELMTAEVNTVVEELYAAGATYVLVNDSHGDIPP